MKGKIDKYGLLCKELPGRGFVACRCINNGSELAPDFRSYYCCNDECTPFDGPLPEKKCAQVDGDGTICPGRCEECEMFKPTGRTEIHYCKGILKFDEFVDERAPK